MDDPTTDPGNVLGETKVTICHIPPGNPGNAHTITIGEPAVRAHLRHGDTIGVCTSVRFRTSSSMGNDSEEKKIPPGQARRETKSKSKKK